jgi:hypothetical protein
MSLPPALLLAVVVALHLYVLTPSLFPSLNQIMGAGKTTVIGPMLAMMLADGKSLVTQVLCCSPPTIFECKLRVSDCYRLTSWF